VFDAPIKEKPLKTKGFFTIPPDGRDLATGDFEGSATFW
jgi:hypothetical protein